MSDMEKRTVKCQEAERETVMYIGPSIKDVVLTGTLYNNGLPEPLKREIERRPVVGSMVLPVNGLSKVYRQLAVPGSAWEVLYDKVKGN